MFYGYSARTLSTSGVSDMKEITIAADPKVLREIAAFILDTASDMEVNKRFDHRHIDEFIEDWRQRFPNRDFIVASPEPPGDIPRVRARDT